MALISLLVGEAYSQTLPYCNPALTHSTLGGGNQLQIPTRGMCYWDVPYEYSLTRLNKACSPNSQSCELPTTTHASLATFTGSAYNIVGCSDCTSADPCGSGGAGALALKVNGVWKCNLLSGALDGSTFLLLAGRSGSANNPLISTDNYGIITGTTGVTGFNLMLRSNATTQAPDPVSINDHMTNIQSGDYYASVDLFSGVVDWDAATNSRVGGDLFSGVWTVGADSAAGTNDQILYGFRRANTVQHDGVSRSLNVHSTVEEGSFYQALGGGDLVISQLNGLRFIPAFSGGSGNDVLLSEMNAVMDMPDFTSAPTSLATTRRGLYWRAPFGATNVQTNAYGIDCENQTAVTEAACMRSALTANGTNRWGFKFTGDAPSATAGGLMVGGATAPEGPGFVNFTQKATGSCGASENWVQASSTSNKLMGCEQGTLFNLNNTVNGSIPEGEYNLVFAEQQAGSTSTDEAGIDALPAGTPTTNNTTGGQYIQYASAASLNANAGWTSSTVGEITRREWYPKATFVMATGASIAVMRTCVGLTHGDCHGADLPTTTGDAFAYFRYSTAAGDTNWKVIHTPVGGTHTVQDTGVAVATNTRYVFKIDGTDTSKLDFYINGALVYSATSNLPGLSEPLSLYMVSRTLEAVSKVINVRRYSMTHR